MKSFLIYMFSFVYLPSDKKQSELQIVLSKVFFFYSIGYVETKAYTMQ